MNRLDLSDTRDRNLGRILQLQAETNGDGVYLMQDDRRVTYAEADRAVNRIAHGLADLGVGRGDRVAFFMASAIEVIYLTLAVNKLGAVWIPVNAEYKGEWLRGLLIDSKPKVIVSDTRLMGRLSEVIADVPHDHALILGGGDLPAWARPFEQLDAYPDVPLDLSFIDYGDVNAVVWTSGTTGKSKGVIQTLWLCITPLDLPVVPDVQTTAFTTGKSKGVMQSHNVWIRSAENGGRSYDTRPGDVHYNVLPMHNTASWTTAIFRCLVDGIAVALDPQFSVSNFWDRTRHYGATQTFTLGSMHMYLWNAPERADDRDNPVRTASMTPMPDWLIGPFSERFGIEKISQGFGQSEMSAVLHRSSDLNGRLKPGALGVPNKDIELRLIDDAGRDVGVDQPGEFAIKPRLPHMMFEGYFENPEATRNAFTADGWYKMGDLGRRDADGDYFFVDRKKDAVRLAGRNISTMEVETALRRHPAIQEVAVFGVTSADLDAEAELAAHVILKPDAQASEEELARFVNDTAPYYFVPRYIEIVAAMPMTPTNKVQKYQLRERGVTANTWDRKAAGFQVTR